MLLSLRDALRRRVHAGARAEAGNALATVIAIVAITGIIAATLLATTMFSTGYASSNRAAVQAQAAADGGVDYALLNLDACSGGVITSPAGTTPVFRVEVDFRTAKGSWQLDQCPTPAVALVRLTSTGTASAPGVDGQTRGNTRTVEAVAKPLPAITSGAGLNILSPLTVTAPNSASADISVAADFACGSGKPVVNHESTLYVSGTYTPAGSCSSKGTAVVAPFDPIAPAFTYPRIGRSDSRWWGLYAVPDFQMFVNGWSYGATNYCSFWADGTHDSDYPLGVLVDSRAKCPNGFKVGAPENGETNPWTGQPYAPFTVVLSGDIALITNGFELDGVMTLTSVPGDTKERAFSIISTWPTDRAGCPVVPAADIKIINGGIRTEGNTRVLLYSANAIEIGDGSDGMSRFKGQIVGCGVTLNQPMELTYAPVGRNMKAPGTVPPMQVVSKRDISR